MNISQIHIFRKGKLVRLGNLFKESLGLDEDYIEHFLKEDDWTMAILSYALIEACLTEAISTRLKRDDLNSYIQLLNMTGRTGKCRLASDLGLLSKNQEKFIEKFSKIRNRFAHSVSYFKVTFDEYFRDNEKSDFVSAFFINSMSRGGEEFYKKGAKPIGHTDFEEKKLIILVNAFILCHALCFSSASSKAE